MPADEPEEHQGPRDVACFRRAVVVDQPCHGAAVALQIFAHAIQPCDLFGSDQPFRGERGFDGAIVRQPLHGVVAFARGNELDGGVRPNGFQHLIQGTRRHDRRLGSMEKALVDQAGRYAESVISLGWATPTAGKDGDRGVDRKQTWQCAEAAKCALFVGVEELITPGNRRIHRLLPFGEIARTNRREQDVALEPAEQVLDCEHLDPRRCELEGERQCIEPAANCRDRRDVPRREPKVGLYVLHPFQKEAYSGSARQIGRRHGLRARFQFERADRIFPLASDTERSPAGNQHSKRRDRCQKIGNEWRGVQHLFEIVEHQHRRAIAAGEARAHRQVTRDYVRQPERLGDHRCDERRIPRRGKRHEHDAGRTFCHDRMRDLERETRLPGSARSGEGNEPCSGICEPVPQCLHVGVATEKGGQWEGQREAAEFVARSLLDWRSRALQQRITSLAGQVECGRERAYCLEMRPSPFAALQCAHAVNREARNRREFFLGEARSLAKCFQLRGK